MVLKDLCGLRIILVCNTMCSTLYIMQGRGAIGMLNLVKGMCTHGHKIIMYVCVYVCTGILALT